LRRELGLVKGERQRKYEKNERMEKKREGDNQGSEKEKEETSRGGYRKEGSVGVGFYKRCIVEAQTKRRSQHRVGGNGHDVAAKNVLDTRIEGKELSLWSRTRRGAEPRERKGDGLETNNKDSRRQESKGVGDMRGEEKKVRWLQKSPRDKSAQTNKIKGWRGTSKTERQGTWGRGNA